MHICCCCWCYAMLFCYASIYCCEIILSSFLYFFLTNKLTSPTKPTLVILPPYTLFPPSSPLKKVVPLSMTGSFECQQTLPKPAGWFSSFQLTSSIFRSQTSTSELKGYFPSSTSDFGLKYIAIKWQTVQIN